MPTISSATPTEAITIAGETFTVAMPYAEGNVLSANEAAALNQVRAENLRNNFASSVNKAKEAGTFDLASMQTSLTEYDSTYEFGVRRGGGGRTSDPVMAEAMNIAREKVRAAILAKGIKLAEVSAAQISEHAKKAINDYPQILELARTRVAEANTIDVSVDVSTDEPVTEGASAATSGRKGKSPPAEATTA